MPNYGVIDLGSNTIRLCVYQVSDGACPPFSRKDFRTLINNKIMAGLSSHVVQGMFTDSGVAHAVDVLKGHAKRLRYFECVRTDVFATAVLRNCLNSKKAIRAIEEGSGFSITLLTEAEEAHLGFRGASIDSALDTGVLIDIGGGSTELTRFEHGIDDQCISLHIGSLSSFSSHVKGILPTEREMVAITEAYADELDRRKVGRRGNDRLAFGIGGSIRAAAKMHAEAFGEAERPGSLSSGDIDQILTFCLDDPNRFAHTALKAAPDRIHTLVPGCLLIRQLLGRFHAESLTICKKGVREGYLIERMLEADAPTSVEGMFNGRR